jgi:UDP:flavonoid glycosyltransferase YjiC (YdhE family)
MKALFFPFCTGPGLAHAGACLSVAGELAARGSEAVLAYGGTRPDLVRGNGVRVIEVEEVPVEWAGGHGQMDGFYPDVETLIRFIEQDRALIEEEAPDVVVIDMRMPSAVAAELAGVPTVTINHFLPFTGHTTLTSWRRRLSMLRHPLRIATRLGSIFDRDPFRAAVLQQRFDGAREELGLPPKDGLPITGPCTAFTTTPFLDPPTGPLPEGWHLVGPVTWSASGGPVPPETGDRPLVFVSQGTLGSKAAIEEIAQGLSGLDAEIAVVTMGAADHGEIESLGEDITALDFVDNDVWLEAADVAVLHGGHITMSAAARAGTPAVVIPDGRDHWAWAAKTTRLGTGISLYRPLLPGSVGRAVRKILTDPGYTERADRLAGKLEGWSGEEKTADLIERVAAEPELGICGSPGS